MKITPHRNLSHMLKDSSLWGSLTKDYNVSTMVFTIISTVFFFKASYSNMIILQVLIATSNTKLLNAIINLKLQSLPHIYLKEKSAWKLSHSFTSIPHVASQMSRATTTFHPSMDRFYIIWGLKFSQNLHTWTPIIIDPK
jgi:hypothetical protein